MACRLVIIFVTIMAPVRLDPLSALTKTTLRGKEFVDTSLLHQYVMVVRLIGAFLLRCCVFEFKDLLVQRFTLVGLN